MADRLPRGASPAGEAPQSRMAGATVLDAGPPFCADALERRFEPLERMHRRLWLPAIVNTEGSIFARLPCVAAWRERLLDGAPPLREGDPWPTPVVARAFRAQVERLELAGVARAHEEVADQVVRSLLWHIDRVAGRTAELPLEEAARRCAEEFHGDWVQRHADLETVLRIFESLDGVASFARFSELRGLLQSEGWAQVLAAHERVARMPKLAALIRRLGRARPAEAQVRRTMALPVQSRSSPEWVRRTREVELPGAPLETQGTRRSGDFSRILASEAMQLRRRDPRGRLAKRLRRLFAARLAEHTLLTYEQRQFAIETTWVQEPGAPRPEREAQLPDLEAGPLIVCVDTSASMRGAPEQVAKAIVLEAMRAATRARRRCLVYAFSGPGEARELELGFDLEGLRALSGFLASSFHGGTDIVEPVRRAIERVRTARWCQADLVIASDGEFGATADLVERLVEAKRRFGVRVQGVLVGDRETIGLSEVCDDIFWVRDWRRYGGDHAQIEPPIHAANLTALYFPGAFVGREGTGGRRDGTRAFREEADRDRDPLG